VLFWANNPGEGLPAPRLFEARYDLAVLRCEQQLRMKGGGLHGCRPRRSKPSVYLGRYLLIGAFCQRRISSLDTGW